MKLIPGLHLTLKLKRLELYLDILLHDPLLTSLRTGGTLPFASELQTLKLSVIFVSLLP